MTDGVSELQSVSGESGHRYFHQMLNMAEDDCDPYQYRLLGHYVRAINHITQESVDETAKKVKMSVTKVLSTRNELVEMGFVVIHEPTPQQRGNGICTAVEVVDRWFENIQRYHRPTPNMEEVVTPNMEEDHGSEPTPNMEHSLKNLNAKKKKDSAADKTAAPATNSGANQPAQEKGSKGAEKPKRINPAEPQFRALAECFRLAPDVLIKNKGAAPLYWKVASELRSVSFPIERTADLHKYIQSKARKENWGSFTVSALSKYVLDFLRDVPVGTTSGGVKTAPAGMSVGDALSRGLLPEGYEWAPFAVDDYLRRRPAVKPASAANG